MAHIRNSHAILVAVVVLGVAASLLFLAFPGFFYVDNPPKTALLSLPPVNKVESAKQTLSQLRERYGSFAGSVGPAVTLPCGGITAPRPDVQPWETPQCAAYTAEVDAGFGNTLRWNSAQALSSSAYTTGQFGKGWSSDYDKYFDLAGSAMHYPGGLVIPYRLEGDHYVPVNPNIAGSIKFEFGTCVETLPEHIKNYYERSNTNDQIFLYSRSADNQIVTTSVVRSPWSDYIESVQFVDRPPLSFSETWDNGARYVQITDSWGDTNALFIDQDARLGSVGHPDQTTTVFWYEGPLMTGECLGGNDGAMYEVSENGVLLGYHNSDGTDITYDYAASGTIRILVDGNPTQEQLFDAQGRLQRVSDKGLVSQYSYDAENRVTQVTTPTGVTKSITYTTSADGTVPGLPKSITSSLGQYANFTYSASGNPTLITSSDEPTVRIDYVSEPGEGENPSRIRKIHPGGPGVTITRSRALTAQGIEQTMTLEGPTGAVLQQTKVTTIPAAAPGSPAGLSGYQQLIEKSSFASEPSQIQVNVSSTGRTASSTDGDWSFNLKGGVATYPSGETVSWSNSGPHTNPQYASSTTYPGGGASITPPSGAQLNAPSKVSAAPLAGGLQSNAVSESGCADGASPCHSNVRTVSVDTGSHILSETSTNCCGSPNCPPRHQFLEVDGKLVGELNCGNE